MGAFLWFWERERALRGQFKLFLLWVAFHSSSAVFGELLADTFTRTGFWYVPDWLFRFGTVVNVLLALVAGGLQLGIGYLAAAPFLQAHDSKTVMQLQNRRLMLLAALIGPWVIGSGFFALTKASYFSLYEALHLVVMGPAGGAHGAGLSQRGICRNRKKVPAHARGVGLIRLGGGSGLAIGSEPAGDL